MRFVLKALFFLAVVAAFIPRQPDAQAASQAASTPDLPSLLAPSDVAVDLEVQAEHAAGAFCERQPALCNTVHETAGAARLVGGIAMQQARQAIADAGQPAQAPPAEDAPAS